MKATCNTVLLSTAFQKLSPQIYEQALLQISFSYFPKLFPLFRLFSSLMFRGDKKAKSGFFPKQLAFFLVMECPEIDFFKEI